MTFEALDGNLVIQLRYLKGVDCLQLFQSARGIDIPFQCFSLPIFRLSKVRLLITRASEDEEAELSLVLYSELGYSSQYRPAHLLETDLAHIATPVLISQINLRPFIIASGKPNLLYRP